MEQEAYLIYLEDCLVLSKKQYHDWREIQAEYYEKYKANLSPMTCEEIIHFFEDDFREEKNWPFSRQSIIDFFCGPAVVLYSTQE